MHVDHEQQRSASDRQELPTADGALAKRRQVLQTLIAVVVVSACWCWLESRFLGETKQRYESQVTALERMRTDAEIIAVLSAAPQSVVETRRSTDELLAEIEAALQHAGIPAERWLDSVPQAAQPTADGVYEKHATRLYFEKVTLEQMVRFCRRLVEANPSLSVSSLRITAPRDHRTAGRLIDLAVTYLVVA